MSEKIISSISICGEIGLNVHSLNNEGGEGNQILTRQVTIVDENGKTYVVNSISGDMLKHIQAEHLYNIAKEKNLPLCEKCKTFNANRISGDEGFAEMIKDKSDEEALDMLAQKCIIDDIEGILITKNNRNIPRKSCAEFGWLIGMPGKVKTETYFHVKLVANAGKEFDDEGANQGQNIFYKPANSGIYAVVCNFDFYRIGYNEITRNYSVDDNSRNERFKAFMESIMYTFIKPTGAMRNTQNPHLLGFKGAVSISRNTIPAPTISALSVNYIEQIKEIAKNINSIEENSIDIEEFGDISEFTKIMTVLISKYKPYKLL